MPPEQSDLTPESSEGVVTQDVPANEAEASSSGADQGDTSESMLDAVRSAIGMDEEEAESPPAERVTESPEEGEPVDRDEMLLATLDALKDDKLPLHKIQRFRETITENKSLKGQLDVVKPAIDRLNEINESARRAGFTADEIAEFFSAPILAATDPAKAHEIVSKFQSRLALASGAQLPADLQDDIDNGYVSEERARELARLRAVATRAQADEQERAAQVQRQQEVSHATKMVDAVNNFQKQLMTTDPDYTPTKHEMVKEALQLLAMREGRPQTEEQAVALAKKAHETVTKRLSQFQPQRRPQQQPSGRRINAPAQTRPSTMKEAIQGALNSG